MNQHYQQDPVVFIRIQMENAWEAGDLAGALRLSRLIDDITCRDDQDVFLPQRQAL